jgi:aspartate kinase
MKFGGTSMGSAEMIAEVGGLIQDAKASNNQLIVVVSAMSGVTNHLIEAAKYASSGTRFSLCEKIVNQLRYQHIEAAKSLVKDPYLLGKITLFIQENLNHFQEFLGAISIIRELSPLSHDEIISLGEKLSAALLSAHLSTNGVSAEYIDLSGIIQKDFQNIGGDFFDHVEEELKKKVQPILEAEKIPVLTGFFGKIPGGIVGGVGRGYTDFTAALSGAAFSVEEIQIWTDVDGLLSADPRMVKYTCVLPEVSYDEAGELAQFGAKVLHPQTVWPAVKKNIPVRIKNTMNPTATGTLITREGKRGVHLCKSVASKKGVTVITLTSSRMLMAVGFLADVFSVFKKHNVSVDVVSTGEISVTISVNRTLHDIPNKLFEDLKTFSKIDVLENQSIICAVGTELRHKKGAAVEILDAISRPGVSIRVISQSAQEINISVILDESDADLALKSLHKVIFEDKSKRAPRKLNRNMIRMDQPHSSEG